MRFLADETRFVVERLRAAGFDVAAIGSASPGASDAEVVAMARREGLILIPENRDFGQLVVRQRLQVQGIVLLELDRLSSVAEADRVATVIAANVGRLSGNLIVVEPGRVRIRPLQ